jgi:hypothetical protein
MTEKLTILACTEASLNSCLEMIGEALEQVCPFETIVLEDVGGDVSSLRQGLDDRENLATILIIEKACLEWESLQEAVRVVIRRTSAQEDFRAYIYLADLTLETFNRLISERKLDTLYDLVDTVQIAQLIDAGGIVVQIREFKAQLRKIRIGMGAKKVREAAAGLTILAAGVFQWCCLIATAVFIMLNLIKLTFPWRDALAPFFPWAAGLVVFPVFLYVVFFLSNLGDAGQHFLPVLAGAVVAVYGFMNVSSLQGTLPAYILALQLGIELEVLRRISFNDRRLLTRIDITDHTPTGGVLPAIVRKAILVGNNLEPFRIPLAADKRPVIFISYTRRSEWGKKIAARLNEVFRLAKSQSFLDTQDIPTGANWRQVLNTAFGKANVFISLVDDFSSERSWPAAELECALRQHGGYAVPKIIVLKKQGLEVEKVQNILPVFDTLLSLIPEATTPLQPDIIDVEDEQDERLERLASQLKVWEFETPGVLPSFLTSLTIVPTLMVTNYFNYVYLAACYLTWIFGLFLVMSAQVNSFFLGLMGTRWVLPVLLLAGFFTGAMLRDLFTLYYEFRLRFTHWNFMPFSILTNLYLLSMFLPHAGLLDWGYTVLAFGLGWLYLIRHEYYSSPLQNPYAKDLSDS